LLAICKIANNKILQGFAYGYTSVFRGHHYYYN